MIPRILLVEDDPVSREVLASLLRTRGYAVDEAGDGFGALRCAQDNSYDLIFIDYHLPEMDGYALARLMRTLGEKTDANLNMVAITADSFGLAARRGADNIFDRILAKPIEPDVLFAFCEDFFGVGEIGAVDAFLDAPASAAPPHPADGLWRARGLSGRPSAAIFPAPSAAERESLEACFHLVAAAEADCLMLCGASGLADLERHRAEAASWLQPLLVLDAGHDSIGDALFDVADGDAWTRAAAVIRGFAERRAAMAAHATTTDDFDQRLCAYLHVADRPLRIARDAEGRAVLPYTAGFAADRAIAAVKRLSAAGLLGARYRDTADGRELEIAPTPKALRGLLARAEAGKVA